jgi:putative PEP-CTERM system TPR-repeat lipoprotein
LGAAFAAVTAGCNMSNDPQQAIAKAQEHRGKRDNKAAIIELKNAIQKNPEHAEARYLLGVTYYDVRDYRLSEQELRRALELKYERSKVLPALAKSMLSLGEFQKVLDEVPLDGITASAAKAEVLTSHARAQMGLGKRDKAGELLEQALAQQPEYADALVEQARLAAGNKKLDEAARLIDRAIASSPKHADAWLVKGELARIGADQAGVMAANQKVLEFDSSNTTARLNIASLHIANNRLDEARKLIAQARSAEPGNVIAVHMQALVDYRARDFKAANDAIQQVLKVAPNYLPGVLLAGAIATELGSHEQAQTHIGRVLERAPGNLYARKLMISTLARSGQMQRAIEVLQIGLKQVPDDNELQTLAGELYLQSGEFNKAAQYFDAATKRDPQNATARTKLGISRMASGETDRAFADLESAVQLDSAKYQTDMVLIVSHLKRGNYDQALKAMESLEKKQPTNPVTYNLKAAIFLGKKDIPSARKNFERALELQPTFLAAATNLAQLDLQEKNPKGARTRLESMLAKDKNNVQALLALAEMGPALGATQKEQVEWLDRAANANPQAVQPQLMLARLYFQMGDAKKALEVAQKAQAKSPDNPQFLDLLGTAQLSTGEKEQALTTYRKLVKLQPKSPAALYRLANAQAAGADPGAAAETLNQALLLKPDFVDAQVALVPLEIRAKRYAEAMRIAQQVQKQNPKAPIGHALEGDVLMAQAKYPLAIKAYETSQGIAKNSAVLVKQHMAYVASGKPDEGDARMSQWLKESPGDASVRFYAAESTMKRGQFKEAIAHYEMLQQKQPENLVVLNNLAWAYAQTKDGRALDIAERAYKLAPDNASVADTLGALLVERGDAARGMELLEKAAKAAPNIAEIHYHLAQGWVKKGDKSKARGELERALSINEKFSDHVEALGLLKKLRE